MIAMRRSTVPSYSNETNGWDDFIASYIEVVTATRVPDAHELGVTQVFCNRSVNA